MTVPSAACEYCGRPVLEKGTTYEIEAALDRDGEAQAVLFLESLYGRRASRGSFFDVFARFEVFGTTGTLTVPLERNHLVGELWEIKAGRVRLPFYYRKGQNCGHVRLTHGFRKGTEKTPLKEINRGLAIIREDKKRDDV